MLIRREDLIEEIKRLLPKEDPDRLADGMIALWQAQEVERKANGEKKLQSSNIRIVK